MANPIYGGGPFLTDFANNSVRMQGLGDTAEANRVQSVQNFAKSLAANLIAREQLKRQSESDQQRNFLGLLQLQRQSELDREARGEQSRQFNEALRAQTSGQSAALGNALEIAKLQSQRIDPSYAARMFGYSLDEKARQEENQVSELEKLRLEHAPIKDRKNSVAIGVGGNLATPDRPIWDYGVSQAIPFWDSNKTKASSALKNYFLEMSPLIEKARRLGFDYDSTADDFFPSQNRIQQSPLPLPATASSPPTPSALSSPTLRTQALDEIRRRPLAARGIAEAFSNMTGENLFE